MTAQLECEPGIVLSGQFEIGLSFDPTLFPKSFLFPFCLKCVRFAQLFRTLEQFSNFAFFLFHDNHSKCSHVH